MEVVVALHRIELPSVSPSHAWHSRTAKWMQGNEERDARLLRSPRGVSTLANRHNSIHSHFLRLVPNTTVNVTAFRGSKNSPFEFTAVSRPRYGQHAASAPFGGPEPPARARAHSSGSNPWWIARGPSIIASFSIRLLRPLRLFRRWLWRRLWAVLRCDSRSRCWVASAAKATAPNGALSGRLGICLQARFT